MAFIELVFDKTILIALTLTLWNMRQRLHGKYMYRLQLYS